MYSKPFLKWPGGKYRLVERIRTALGPGKRLIEPFVGSAAVFMNTDYPAYLVGDSNADLIGLYRHLHAEGEAFIEYVRPFFQEECNRADVYYAFRALFNQTRDERLKAALFVYLNRHCYNGLCRYNRSGGFNTPFGRYKKPLFPEQAMRAFQRKAGQARFQSADFRALMAQAEPGDVVYCDPPYTPLSETSNFTDYSAGGFGWQEQLELAAQADKLAASGIRVVISNHDTAEIRKLYRTARLQRFPVRRSISCAGTRRGHAAEILAVY